MNRTKCFGVGICDVDYPIQIENKRVKGQKRQVIWRCPYYQTWISILRRAYSEKQQTRTPTYVECSVDCRWHKLSNFKSWVESQPLHYLWSENNQLIQVDKDFLIDENKIYSPDTCILLPAFINSLLTGLSKNVGDYALGVSYKKANRKFQSQVYTEGRKVYLGLYEDPIKAHLHWQLAKLSCLQDSRDEYEDLSGHDDRVLAKLNKIIESMRADVIEKKETKFNR